MKLSKKNTAYIDTFALFAWGILLLKYCLSGEINLLINPNYFSLVMGTSVVLISLSLIRTRQILRKSEAAFISSDNQHITFLPKNWSTILLLITALSGLLIPPKVLTSQTALQRGVTESLPLTRVQTAVFRTKTKPEERSLVDWVRTLNAYPEPDAYTGQRAKIDGFVVHLPQLPENYLLLSRFIVTCCAVDAYPVGIPIRLKGNKDIYPADTWLKVEGEMTTEILGLETKQVKTSISGKRQLILVAESIQQISTPSNPYDY